MVLLGLALGAQKNHQDSESYLQLEIDEDEFLAKMFLRDRWEFIDIDFELRDSKFNGRYGIFGIEIAGRAMKSRRCCGCLLRCG